MCFAYVCACYPLKADVLNFPVRVCVCAYVSLCACMLVCVHFAFVSVRVS